jgi:cyanophycinase-like exopeptidase
MKTPGLIALLGSGETAAAGGQVYDLLAEHLSPKAHIAVLETPAGFELNSAAVAGRVAEFIRQRLHHLAPQIHAIAARRKDSLYSPDRPETIEALYASRMIFLGPGSPTYAVRQLADSLAWDAVRALHYAGAAVVVASAAAIAAGSFALPVYEIYKAGYDPYWTPGLGLLTAYGLRLAIIPHWNNSDGGSGLDTSHCFMGQARFEQLLAMLPVEAVVLGLDEHTALLLDLQAQQARVIGHGAVHIWRNQVETTCPSEMTFPLSWLGEVQIPQLSELGIRAEVLLRVQNEGSNDPAAASQLPPEDVSVLLTLRLAARAAKNWPESDRLRQEIAAKGWTVQDTVQGPVLVKN